MAHLHAKKLYHRDLKLENVAIDERGRVRLIDFGSSTVVDEGTTASAVSDVSDTDGRLAVIKSSQKNTRAPEIALGEFTGQEEDQEKVRCMQAHNHACIGWTVVIFKHSNVPPQPFKIASPNVPPHGGSDPNSVPW